ncbi:hypothetical protein ABLE92_07165 [Gordonia sp. VNQ95]|uniref:hypothetical protein n=1 Tax=Gordonia TaxID=2053 RepID=UPI0032B42F93
MLTLALAATLVGFVLLVVGLITGTLWLAVACIVVCLVGLIFLVADIVWSGRRTKPEPDRGGGFGFGTDEDAAAHDERDAGDDAGPTGDEAGSAQTVAAGDEPSSSPPPHPGGPRAVPMSAEDERAALWQGVVTPRSPAEPPASHAEKADRTPVPPAQPTGDSPTVDSPNVDSTVDSPTTAERGYADYLRSVGAADIVDTPKPADVPAPPAPGSVPTSSSSGATDPAVTRAQPQATSDADADREDPPPPRTIDPLDPNWRPPLS